MDIRGLLRSGSDEKHVCTEVSLEQNASQKFVGNMTFYEFNRVFSGACALFTIIMMLLFLVMHATHFSKPNEQFKILRISLVIPLYALVSWIAIEAPVTNAYLHPWVEFVQSISLCSFFLLLCEFVSPSEKTRDMFFAALTVQDKKSPTGTRDALSWFKTRWILIFQYPVVALLVAIFTDITQGAGVYCEFETKPYFAKLWLTIALNMSTAIAVLSVIKLYGLLKTHLAHHKPLAKLLSFKLIVGLSFLMNIILLILNGTNNLNPSATLTYADLHIGIPAMVSCIEMVFFSLFFFYAYPWSPYLLRNQKTMLVNAAGEAGVQFTPSYQGGPMGIYALLGMLNPGEIIEALVFAVKMQSEAKRRQRVGATSPVNEQEYNLLAHQQQTAAQQPYAQVHYDTAHHYNGVQGR